MLPNLHRLPLKAPTGNYFGPDRGAAEEAKWFRDVVMATWSSGGPTVQWPAIEAQMRIIANRIGEDGYLGWLHQFFDFEYALANLIAIFLQQENTSPYYEMQAKIVEFTYRTGNEKIMRTTKRIMSGMPGEGPTHFHNLRSLSDRHTNEKGINKLYHVLGRFAAAAWARGDMQLGKMATELQGSIP